MLNKFKVLVGASGPNPDLGEHIPESNRAGMVIDVAEGTWVAGLIPTAETPRHPYTRPEFLYLTSEDEIDVSGDQVTRPVLVPKDPLKMPLYAGYAETINAGKTIQNEDQASAKVLQIVSKKALPPSPVLLTKPGGKGKARSGRIPVKSESSEDVSEGEEALSGRYAPEDVHDESMIPVEEESEDESGNQVCCREEGVFFGIFDGHAGSGAALAAANCLHEHVKEKLANVLDLIVQYDVQEKVFTRNSESLPIEPLQSSSSLTVRPSGEAPLLTVGGKHVTRDELVIGALETAFVDMVKIAQFIVEGLGCAAIVALAFMRKLYIANAGDCRALICVGEAYEQLSTDFTPDAERKRLQYTTYIYPEYANRDYSRFEYSRRLTRKDLKKRVLYRDWFMDGWALKTVRETDLKPPIISSGTKKVKVCDLSTITLGHLDVLVLATDGLWDVLSNSDVFTAVRNTLAQYDENDVTKYTLAAQDLVALARGVQNQSSDNRHYSGRWQLAKNGGSEELNCSSSDNGSTGGAAAASCDDISVFVIPLKFALSPPVQEDDDELLKAF